MTSASVELLKRFVSDMCALVDDPRRPRGGSSLSGELRDVLKLGEGVMHAGWTWQQIAGRIPRGARVLDFGCGAGAHRALIQRGGFQWVGCDYSASKDPLTLARVGTPLDGEITKYDGVSLPFGDAEFDAVWSWQSFEHTERPESSMAEVSRCLKNGGLFVGSTSFLEPYHAESTFGFSAYGFRLLCDRHGLRLESIYPRIDGLSLMVRRLAGILGLEDGPEVYKELLQTNVLSPVAEMLRQAGRAEQIPDAMAQLCGSFAFVAWKR